MDSEGGRLMVGVLVLLMLRILLVADLSQMLKRSDVSQVDRTFIYLSERGYNCVTERYILYGPMPLKVIHYPTQALCIDTYQYLGTR